MSLPPNIANDVGAILQYGQTSVISILSDQVGAYAWYQMRRALYRWYPVLADSDPKELSKRVVRLETTIEGMSEALTALQSERDGELPSDDEMEEPATQEFLTDAFAAAMESPDEEKRRVLGRLIAERLYAQTESSDELYLRQALAIARQINRRHLHLLATLYLVHETPMPEEEMARRDVYDWLDRTQLPTLRKMLDDELGYGDLEYLVTVGAISFSESLSTELSGGMLTHATAIEHNLLRATGEHIVQVPGTHVGEFYRLADYLYRGERDRDRGRIQIPLGAYALTIAGREIAVGCLSP